jgi:hypothetical protein
MSYTEPRILRNDEVILAIQSVGSSDPHKPVDVYLESNSPPSYSTVGAYEADE